MTNQLRLVSRPRRSGKQTEAAAAKKLAVSAQRPTFEASPNILQYQRLQSLSRRNSRQSKELASILAEMRDYNPDVSKAKENIVALANPGYTLDVYYADSAETDGDPRPDVEGLRLCRQFAQRIASEYSGAWDETVGKGDDYAGLNRFIDIIHQTVYTFGAMAGEVQLTPSLDDIVDVFPVDPNWIDFNWDEASQRIVPGLMIGGVFKPLDPIRFRYIGKDPDINDPSGRSPLLAVMDTVFFQQQFMRELQAIAHMMNTPRLDVKIIEETAANALKAVRPDLFSGGSEKALQAEIAGYISDIQSVIESLQPDDAFVHLDSVDAKFVGPQGTAIPVQQIIDAISQMMVSGTKMLPMLLGRNEGATTTHATVQWQVFILELGAYQRISSAFVVWLFNLYLRIKGRQSYVVFKYDEHKTSDELIDSQARNMNAITWGLMVDRGWATDDEAAEELLGHPATGVPKPPPEPPAPEPTPTAPPRGMALDDDGTRVVADSVGELPQWLQRVHHSAHRDYTHWRIETVTPKFTQATRRLYTIGEMSDAEAQRWLFNQLKLVDADRNRLNEALRQSGRKASVATIEEQLRAIHRPQRVTLTNKKLLRDIDDRARDSAKSIINTYNDDLRLVIAEQFDIANRDLGDLIRKMRQVITGIIGWESLRNAWKSAQVSMAETQETITRTVKEFFDRNEVEGQAEVYPYSSTPDICADYISRNPYPDMQTALAETSLPAHIHCPHYVRLINGGSVAEGIAIWAGGD